jgi:cytidyltransferase-like protein
MSCVVISAPFDTLGAKDLRFLQEASRLGELHIVLWTDSAIAALAGKAPTFPFAERAYFLQASRYVAQVHASGAEIKADELPPLDFKPDFWAVNALDDTPGKKAYCEAKGITYRVVSAAETDGFPVLPPRLPAGGKKVVVTGCYDWFHTGHIAFFEEVSELGDLHVVVGNDANLKLLKGEGHPLFSEEERRYNVGSMRFVTQAHVSSGSGWMDAEPEICNVIKPDMYAVNEDGDKPEKREFCAKHGIEYVVLKRVPKAGLLRRSSTDLRGF